MPSSTEVQEHLLYANVTNLMIDVPLNIKTFNQLPAFTVFQNINYLSIKCESQRTNFWKIFMNLSKRTLHYHSIFFACLVHILHIDNKIYQKECFNRLARLVNFNRITKLEFQRTKDLSHLYFIEQILL